MQRLTPSTHKDGHVQNGQTSNQTAPQANTTSAEEHVLHSLQHTLEHNQATPGPDHTSIRNKITGSASSSTSLAQRLLQHGGKTQGTCPPLSMYSGR